MRLASSLRRPIVWLPISIGLLGLLVWRGRPWDAAGSIGVVDPVPLVVAILLSLAIAILWAVRSADLFRGADRPVGVLRLIPMTAFANTINNVTPGSTGEVIRMYLLRAHHDIDYATSGAVIFVERVGAIGYLTTSAILAWATWVGALPPVVALVIAIALIAGPGVMYRAGLRPFAVVRALPFGGLVGVVRWTRITDWLGRVDQTVALLLGRPRRLLGFVGLTGAILATYTAQLLLVGRAIGVNLDPLAAWGALGLATAIGVLSLLPFGLGSADLGLAGLLGAAGVTPAAAVAIALGYRLASTLPLGIAGVLSYAWLSARLPERRGMLDAARGVSAHLGDAPADPALDR